MKYCFFMGENINKSIQITIEHCIVYFFTPLEFVTYIFRIKLPIFAHEKSKLNYFLWKLFIWEL